MGWKMNWIAGADALTGGLVSLVAGQPPGTAAAAALVAEATEGAGSRAGGGQQGPRPGTSAGAGSKPPSDCCPRYQLSDGMLLETNTGRVWKYDQAQNAFISVPKKLSHLDYWRTKVSVGDVLERVQQEFDEEVISKLPDAMKKAARKEFSEEFVKVMQDEVEKMKPK